LSNPVILMTGNVVQKAEVEYPEMTSCQRVMPKRSYVNTANYLSLTPYRQTIHNILRKGIDKSADQYHDINQCGRNQAYDTQGSKKSKIYQRVPLCSNVSLRDQWPHARSRFDSRSVNRSNFPGGTPNHFAKGLRKYRVMLCRILVTKPKQAEPRRNSNFREGIRSMTLRTMRRKSCSMQ
jgi:hypothetical protein